MSRHALILDENSSQRSFFFVSGVFLTKVSGSQEKSVSFVYLTVRSWKSWNQKLLKLTSAVGYFLIDCFHQMKQKGVMNIELVGC